MKSIQKRKAEIIKKRGECQYCEAIDNLAVHHVNGSKDPYYKELTHIIVLCNKCHFILHKFGLRLCSKCNSRYHKLKWEMCWDCHVKEAKKSDPCSVCKYESACMDGICTKEEFDFVNNCSNYGPEDAEYRNNYSWEDYVKDNKQFLDQACGRIKQ